MDNKYYIDKIEELNLENINIKDSKEYQNSIYKIELINLLKKCKFIKFAKKIYSNNYNKHKLKLTFKYDVYRDLENDYKPNFIENKKDIKIVVYTCITGNYDNIQEPYLEDANIDYIAFCEKKENYKSTWKFESIPLNIKKINNNILINRYIKFHPHELFAEKYDYAIYIDGNIKSMSDLKELIYGINSKTGLALHRHRARNCIYNEIEVCKIIKKGNYREMKAQTDRYKEEGFPKEFGLYECNVIVSDLKNKESEKILNSWWEEFEKSKSYRDQIVLPYVVWKNGFDFNDIGSLGNNVYKNPKFRIISHRK